MDETGTMQAVGRRIGAHPDALTTNIEDTLRNIRQGAFLFELTQAVEKLVEAVREHKKEGKVEITLAMEPYSTDASAVTIRDTIKVKKPTKAPGKSIFFTNNKNGLQRTDPRQLTLPGQDIED